MTLAVFAAAAIHGGVLFGWPRGEKPPLREIITTIILEPFPTPSVDDELPTPPPDTEVKPQKGVPRPASEEPPAVAINPEFPIPRVPAPPVEVGPLKSILAGPAGVENGIEGALKMAVIPSSLLDNSPRTLAQTPPQYPFDKKREGIRGEVHVEFTVDESGRVLEPRVVHSTDRAFEAPTIAAVSKWRFEPGRRDGRVVRFRMIVPVVFNLNE